MLDLSRQYAAIRGEILAAVERVCNSQRYILGDEVTALEQEFATECSTAESVACASGTDALWLALAAAGVKNGDSVAFRVMRSPGRGSDWQPLYLAGELGNTQ